MTFGKGVIQVTDVRLVHVFSTLKGTPTEKRPAERLVLGTLVHAELHQMC